MIELQTRGAERGDSRYKIMKRLIYRKQPGVVEGAGSQTPGCKPRVSGQVA